MSAAVAYATDLHRQGETARRVLRGEPQARAQLVERQPLVSATFVAVWSWLGLLRALPAKEALAQLIPSCIAVLFRESTLEQRETVAVWVAYWLDRGLNPARLLALRVWHLLRRTAPVAAARRAVAAAAAKDRPEATVQQLLERRIAAIGRKLVRQVCDELAERALIDMAKLGLELPAEGVPLDLLEDEPPGEAPGAEFLAWYPVLTRDEAAAHGLFDRQEKPLPPELAPAPPGPRPDG
ncbi:MAG: hypothetical protein U1E14_16365 [Geminicoccaceae bacterium]